MFHALLVLHTLHCALYFIYLIILMIESYAFIMFSTFSIYHTTCCLENLFMILVFVFFSFQESNGRY